MFKRMLCLFFGHKPTHELHETSWMQLDGYVLSVCKRCKAVMGLYTIKEKLDGVSEE